MDSLDLTDEPHPRLPVQGHILSVGGDAISMQLRSWWSSWGATSLWMTDCIRPKSLSASRSKLPIWILPEMAMKVIFTRLQPYWEMAGEQPAWVTHAVELMWMADCYKTLRPKSLSTSRSKLPIWILLEMAMKVIFTRLQSYWEMALELVMGEKLSGASMAFIMLFVSWILVHFATSLLFKKKNLPPCEPCFPLSSSNIIVQYLEPTSKTVQLVLKETTKPIMLKSSLTILEITISNS